MSSNTKPLIAGEFYHVYNRAPGKELLFFYQRDYVHWLELIKKYILPHCQLYAYCLLPNHFHLLLKINEDIKLNDFSKGLSDACNSYTKWFNKVYSRKGSLFMRPFKRKRIIDNNQLGWVFWYIHRNPLHHGVTTDWANWKYSSYQAYISEKPTAIPVDYFLNFFGGAERLIKHHQLQANDYIMNLIEIE